MTTFFNKTVLEAGDSSIIHLKLVFLYRLYFFAVDSFGMTFHSFEGIGEEAAIRDKFLLIIHFQILIAASSPPLTLTESVIPN
jgi:hypothetical protein